MCLIPHPNTPTERTFSKYQIIKDAKKNQLKTDVIESLIRIKEQMQYLSYDNIKLIASKILDTKE